MTTRVIPFAKCLWWGLMGLFIVVVLYGMKRYATLSTGWEPVWKPNQDLLHHQDRDYQKQHTQTTKPVWKPNQDLLLQQDRDYQKQHTQNTKPVNHIAYLKIHKAASTTIAHIFLRYGSEHNLVFALPRGKGGGGPSLTSQYFYPPPRNGTYDISCGHVRYNREEFSRVLPNVLQKSGNNPVLDYLSNTERHMKYKGYVDLHNMAHQFNMMAIEFGFPKELFYTRNQTKIQSYLHKLDKEMYMVIVVEYFDESIVLMRRLLNWDLKDVLYCKFHVRKVRELKKKEILHLQFGSIEENLYKGQSYLDYALYEYFLRRMEETLNLQSPDFFEEVAYFRKTRIQFGQWCLSTRTDNQSIHEVSIEGSEWNKPFVINQRLCKHVFNSAGYTV